MATTPMSNNPHEANAQAADSLLKIARDKSAARRRIDGTDKFSENARNQPWAPDNFDALLGSKRTTSGS